MIVETLAKHLWVFAKANSEGITKNYDLGELAQKHRQAGADFWIIREKYLSLITDLKMGEKPVESLQEERDALRGVARRVFGGTKYNVRSLQEGTGGPAEAGN